MPDPTFVRGEKNHALYVEYCSGEVRVHEFERRTRMYSEYAHELALFVTQENLQENEKYQPFHVKKITIVVFNDDGTLKYEPVVWPSEEHEIKCFEKHNAPPKYNPYSVYLADQPVVA